MKEVLRDFGQSRADADTILALRTGRQTHASRRWIKGLRNPLGFDRVIVLFVLEEYGYLIDEIDALPDELRILGRLMSRAGDYHKAAALGSRVLQVQSQQVVHFFKFPTEVQEIHYARIRAHMQSTNIGTEVLVKNIGKEWKQSVFNAFLYSLGSVQHLGDLLVSSVFSEGDRIELRDLSIKTGTSIFQVSDVIRALLSKEALTRYQQLQQKQQERENL
jgi:hypothetical protein